MALRFLLPLFLFGCAGPQSSQLHKNEPPSPIEKRLDEPERVIHCGDLIKITIKFPGRALGSLEAVQKDGDVATPEGSFIKANGLSLASFRADLIALYASVPSYEEVLIEASIASSPYSVVQFNPSRSSLPRDKNATTSANKSSVSEKSAPAAPTIYSRNFKTPLTVWRAIQIEGGIPTGVDPRQIRVLKRSLARKTLDCGGKNGMPDGDTPIESGDYLFLVPDDVPVSKIFD